MKNILDKIDNETIDNNFNCSGCFYWFTNLSHSQETCRNFFWQIM